jgi:hypothetical protein
MFRIPEKKTSKLSAIFSRPLRPFAAISKPNICVSLLFRGHPPHSFDNGFEGR